MVKVPDTAAENRALLSQKGVVLVNLVGSPGVGKTTLLEKVLPNVKVGLMVGVILGDPFTARDAERIRETGVEAVQVNTETAGYLDAAAVRDALRQLPLDALDLVVIENVGGAVLPAAYDVGENVRIALTSVTEGMDKTFKYPLLFEGVYATVVTKIDLLPHTDFSLGGFIEQLFAMNPATRVFPVSTVSEEGVEEWGKFLSKLVWGNRRSINV